MPLSRRTLFAAGALAAAPLAAPVTARAQATDPRFAERATGRPDAPVTVHEFFSLSCGHCAAFHRDTYPRVKRELVETGQIRLVWRDFPLEPRAMAGAMVARSLPPERYEGFIGVLMAQQDRWAFTRGDPLEELAKLAALAGMGRPQFDQATRDEALLRFLQESRAIGERDFAVQATPSFTFQGRTRINHSGNLPFDRFQQLVQEARRA